MYNATKSASKAYKSALAEAEVAFRGACIGALSDLAKKTADIPEARSIIEKVIRVVNMSPVWMLHDLCTERGLRSFLTSNAGTSAEAAAAVDAILEVAANA